MPPGPSRVSSPSGQAGDPGLEAELGDRALDRGARDRPEERDVLGERAGQDLGALGDHADRGAQLLQVEVEDVDAAEEHRAALAARPRGRAARPASTCRSRCARPARTWCRRGRAGRRAAARSGPRRRRSAGREPHVERARGQLGRRRRARARRRAGRAGGSPRRSPACRSGRCRASWSTWPTNIVVTRNSVTSAAVAEAAVDDQRDPEQRGGREHAVQQRAGAATDPALEPEHHREPVRARLAGQLGAAAQDVAPGPGWRAGRRGRRRPPPCAAAWSVHAISSSTLRAESRGSSGRTTASAATPASGKRMNAGHHVKPATIHSGPDASNVRIACQALCRSSMPTSWVSSSTRSSTSPTACSLSAESGWCSAASSRSARSRPSARSTSAGPQRAGDGVEQGRADDAQGEQPDQARVACSASRPATSEPSEVPTAPHSAGDERPEGDRRAQPAPVDRAVERGRGGRGPGGARASSTSVRVIE